MRKQGDVRAWVRNNAVTVMFVLLCIICIIYSGQSMSYVGRSYADSPEVDGHIYFTAEEPVEAGTFARVRITGTMDGDLTGELVEEA